MPTHRTRLEAWVRQHPTGDAAENRGHIGRSDRSTRGIARQRLAGGCDDARHQSHSLTASGMTMQHPGQDRRAAKKVRQHRFESGSVARGQRYGRRRSGEGLCF
jgi:hypothetical protein